MARSFRMIRSARAAGDSVVDQRHSLLRKFKSQETVSPFFLARVAAVIAAFAAAFRQRRGDPGNVKPLGVREGGVPFVVVRLGLGYARSCPIVDDVARALIGAGLLQSRRRIVQRCFDLRGRCPPQSCLAQRCRQSVIALSGSAVTKRLSPPRWAMDTANVCLGPGEGCIQGAGHCLPSRRLSGASKRTMISPNVTIRFIPLCSLRSRQLP